MISCQNALRGPYWIGTTRFDAPLPTGWLPGDSVHPETQELQRFKHGPVVGIVDLTNRTRFGFSSRGVPQYLFFPMNAGYPPMIVGSKASTTANQFGIVRFENWNTTKSKWPHGALQELLGPVGDSTIELEALRLRICHPHRPTRHGSDSFVACQTLCGVEEIWDACFNIDPPGCRDVDDVVSWRATSDGWEFGIHIANVAAWVSEGSILDLEARIRGTTIYENGTVLRPMLPPELSENNASLLTDGTLKPVLSAIWRFSKVGHCLTPEPLIIPTQIRIQTAFTYDSVLLDSETCEKLKFFLKGLCGTHIDEDPHRWIEIAMISYNRVAARALKRNGMGLLRRHTGALPHATELQEIAKKTECTDIAWLAQAAGEYCPASEEACQHAGLGESIYCHATSPLRRYADLINQRILLGVSEAGPAFQELSFQLNQINKSVRQWERDVWCTQHLKPSEISEANGWILGWKEKGEEIQLLIYVPTWKRTIRIGFFRSSDQSEEMGGRKGICLKPRNFGKEWIAEKGHAVQIRAFCDLRKAQFSERFVFSCALIQG